MNVSGLRFHSCLHLGSEVVLLLLPPANEIWGKVIFSEVCVKNSVHMPQCMLGYHHPPGPGTPPGTRHTPQDHAHSPGPGTPPGQGTPPDQVPLRTRHTPWDQAPPLGPDPPCAVHAGRYGQQAGGMHPTGMQSCCECILFVNIVNSST